MNSFTPIANGRIPRIRIQPFGIANATPNSKVRLTVTIAAKPSIDLPQSVVLVRAAQEHGQQENVVKVGGGEGRHAGRKNIDDRTHLSMISRAAMFTGSRLRANRPLRTALRRFADVNEHVAYRRRVSS